MTSEQYVAALIHLDLTQVHAGELLSSPRTSRRWAAGDTPIPNAVAFVLDALIEGKLTIADLERYAKRNTK